MMVRALLRLQEVPRPDHAADALGCALCHVHTLALGAKVAEALEAADSGALPAAEEMNPRKALLMQTRSARRRRR